MTSPTALMLGARDLAVERGGRIVFSDLDFRVSSGAALVVTGRNGAGKSTLLRTIAGLLKPSAGALTLEGGDPERTIGQQCHYFGHQDALKTALSVEENLAFWRAFNDRPAAGVFDALEAVGLGRLAGLPAAYLSAGQRRRLSLARLIVSERPIWLLDEPTSALDAASERMFLGLLEAHLGRGGIAVAATHLPLAIASTVRLEIGAAVAVEAGIGELSA